MPSLQKETFLLMNMTELTRDFLSLHISLLPRYWSLKVSSTESSATDSGQTLLTITSLKVLRRNESAMLLST